MGLRISQSLVVPLPSPCGFTDFNLSTPKQKADAFFTAFLSPVGAQLCPVFGEAGFLDFWGF